jgi:hypothetical protein
VTVGPRDLGTLAGTIDARMNAVSAAGISTRTRRFLRSRPYSAPALLLSSPGAIKCQVIPRPASVSALFRPRTAEHLGKGVCII